MFPLAFLWNSKNRETEWYLNDFLAKLYCIQIRMLDLQQKFFYSPCTILKYPTSKIAKPSSL